VALDHLEMKLPSGRISFTIVVLSDVDDAGCHVPTTRCRICASVGVLLHAVRNRLNTDNKTMYLIKRSMMPTKKAEPPPTRGVNRDSGTASANGG
jgi:hypothetical protein